MPGSARLVLPPAARDDGAGDGTTSTSGGGGDGGGRPGLFVTAPIARRRLLLQVLW